MLVKRNERLKVDVAILINLISDMLPGLCYFPAVPRTLDLAR